MKELLSTDPAWEVRKNHLQHLAYFMEWGAKTWQQLMSHAFEHFLGTNLHGQQVLEVGTRYGKMACLFALLGAKVIGVDLNKESLSVAQREATKWDITDRIAFIQGGNNLALFRDGSFDVVFSKSVLVVVPSLVQFLEEVNAKLKPGGKVVFLENAKGPWFLHVLRALWHWKWDYTRARYFAAQELGMVSEIFDGVVLQKRAFPPIVLILARKRE